MRSLCVGLLALIVTGALSSCSFRETPEEQHHDANTAAGKVGQAAHKAVVEANKAGKVVERELDKAAHDAYEGWKEADHKEKPAR